MPGRKNFRAAKRQGKLLWPSGGSGALPQKIFKIKGPRLATNAFPKILAWRKLIKISQHVALLLNLGVLKKLLAWVGKGANGPLAPASYGPDNLFDLCTFSFERNKVV